MSHLSLLSAASEEEKKNEAHLAKTLLIYENYFFDREWLYGDWCGIE
jgi:hypothetical protein